MSKSKFIQELRKFVRSRGAGTPDGYGRIGYNPSRGEVLLAGGFADYLEAHDEIPEEQFGLNWFRDLPCYLVDAYCEFRTHGRFQELRDRYQVEMESQHGIPDLLDSRGGFNRQFTVLNLIRLMPILAEAAGCNEGWLGKHLECYFNAQPTIIDQAWRNFVRSHYQPLMTRINKEFHRGNSGEFGGVNVMSYAIAGRVMITFQRGGDSVTAVCDDGDPLGHRSGLNHSDANFITAYQMIVDATDNWDLSKFTKNDKIGF